MVVGSGLMLNMWMRCGRWGWLMVYVPPFAMGLRRMGHPGYKGRVSASNGKSEMRGFFAALRMTGRVGLAVWGAWAGCFAWSVWLGALAVQLSDGVELLLEGHVVDGG